MMKGVGSMKKGLWLLIVVFSFLLVACSNDSTDSTKNSTSNESSVSAEDSVSNDGNATNSPKELNLVLGSEPTTLHPGMANDSFSIGLIRNLFEGLTEMKDGKPQLAAAEKYEVSHDQLVYTFTLRDAKWSNGDPVTAEDFVYSWQWALNPENASPYASILYPIKGAQQYNTGAGSAEDVGVKAIDEKTLEVTLSNPTAYFLELTSFSTLLPFNQKAAKENENWFNENSFVTNGYYTLEEWIHGGSITLTKNESYWDAENVQVNKINIAIVESDSTQMAMFDAGEIDFIGSPFGNVALDKIDELKATRSLNATKKSGVYWYKFNTNDELISNVNIRKALTLAINRKDLIKNILKGAQDPALGLVPNAVKGFGDDEGYFKDADYEGAREALAIGLNEFGISNPSDVTVTISYFTNEGDAAVAQFIQQNWTKELGINVELTHSEWPVYIEELNHFNYQIGRLGWTGDYNDAYTFLEMYDTAKNPNNQTGWENETYKSLLTKSTIEKDPQNRIDLLRQAEAIAMKEYPVAPIYYYTNLYVVKDYVTGMVPDFLSNYNFKYVDVNR